jgi:signal transduction histidine kinase
LLQTKRKNSNGSRQYPLGLLKKTLLVISLFVYGDLVAFEVSADSIQRQINQQIDSSLNWSNRNPDRALQIARQALPKADQHQLLREKADLLRIIGLVMFYKVDYSQALDYFMQSRDLSRQITYLKGEAAALNNISVVYQEQKLYSQTLKMDSTVLKLRLQLGDPELIAGSYNNLAVSFEYLNQPREALLNYHKAVNISKNAALENSLSLYYNNIGKIHLKNRQPDSAYRYFNKSLALSRKQNNLQMQTNALTYLGTYYIQQNQPQKAIGHLEKSLAIAQSIGIVYEIESAAKQLHQAYAATGSYGKAYRAHLLFKQMEDSANNMETMQKILQIENDLIFNKERELENTRNANKALENQVELTRQMQFRNLSLLSTLALLLILLITYRSYQRKSRNNQALRKQKNQILAQKEEIESQRDKIEALNNTKDKFMAIIAHDLRNPLSGVYRLSEMMISDFENMEKKKLRLYTEQIFHSSEKAFVLLENLLQWAMVQLGKQPVKPEAINITDILHDNVALLNSLTCQKQITLTFADCNQCLIMGDRQMVNTIVRNILSNAVKFTPPNGSIKIFTHEEPDSWTIGVKDSGIGIASTHLPHLFKLSEQSKKIGNSKEKGTGLGLVLCKEFIDLNKGKLSVESQPDKGSTFYITLPKAHN